MVRRTAFSGGTTVQVLSNDDGDTNVAAAPDAADNDDDDVDHL